MRKRSRTDDICLDTGFEMIGEMNNHPQKFTKETGCIFMVIVALIGLGGGLITHWWTKEYTYTTYVIKDDNTDKRVEMITDKHVDMITGKRVDMTTDKNGDMTTDKCIDRTTDKRVDMTTDKNADMITDKRVDMTTDKREDMTTDQREDIGSMRQELLQCKTRITQIKQDFTRLQTNFTETQEKVEHLTKVITDSIKNARDDFLHLKRDMKILNGMQEIHDHRYITYSETAFFLLVGLILEPLIFFLIVYKYFPWRNGIHGSQG